MGDVQEETCITAPTTSSGCFRGCAQTHGAVALRIQMCYSRLEFGHGMNRRRAPACAACRVCAVCRQPPVPPRPCGASVRWRRAGGPEASVSEFYLNQLIVNERPYSLYSDEGTPLCAVPKWCVVSGMPYGLYITDKTQTSGNAVVCPPTTDAGGRRGQER